MLRRLLVLPLLTLGFSPHTTRPRTTLLFSEVASLRVSEIRSELDERGVSYDDCFDKESLVQRLKEAREKGVEKKEEEPAVDEATDSEAPVIDINEIRKMRVKELREELARRNKRWAGLLEKEDLVQAVVAARKEAAIFSATGLIAPGQVGALTGEQARQEVAHSGSPLLLDVFATWCGPCQMIAPILQQVAQDMTNVRFGKMDSDKYPQESSQWRVQGLPTLILFSNGQEVDRLEGALPKDQLQAWIESKLP